MATASYTTDLVTLNLLDNNASPFAVGEPTGSVAGTTIATETDHFVVGVACVSKIFNATGIGGLGFLASAPITVPADGAIYMWTNFLAANAINVKSAGGMQILVGNTLANYKRFYIYGDDLVPYGGWQVNAVNPSLPSSLNQGTPTGVWQYFGIAVNVQASVARGYPLAWDAVRYGRGSIIMTNGDITNGYATFDQAATTNDTNIAGSFNRWGIFSFSNGIYILQGRLAFGGAGTAVDFRDSNRSISIKSTDFVSPNFNTLEIINVNSRVDWTNISVSSLTTVSKGRVLVTDNADFNLTGCSFTDMDTFNFLSNTTVNDCVFRRCNLITHGNSTFTANRVTSSTASIALTTANPNTLQNNTFISSGVGHAIEITAPGTYTFSGNVFTNYGLIDTTNAAVYNNSGGAVTLNIVDGGSLPTYRNSAGSTTNLNVSKTFVVSNLVYNSELRLFRKSDDVELAGVENIGVTTASNGVVTGPDSNGRYTFSYSHSLSNTVVKVIVISITDLASPPKSYQAYYQEITLDITSDQSLLVSQVIDRNYSNP